jgi:hypothetical protein
MLVQLNARFGKYLINDTDAKRLERQNVAHDQVNNIS